MSDKIPPYDTFTRVELTALIHSQKLKIAKLQEESPGRDRLAQCEVFPSGFQSDEIGMDRSDWSVAWSDLMMTMFILFVVLYCYQISFHPPIWGDVSGRDRASATIGGERKISTTSPDTLGAPAGLSLATQYKEGRMVLQEKKLGNFASLDLVNDKTMRVNLTGELLFDQGSRDLLPQARYFLRDLVPLLQIAPYKIEIIGHADKSLAENQDTDSWELSMQRAKTVAKVLMAYKGLAENRFVISGAGSSRPAFAATSHENNSKNRRVEVILTLKEPDNAVTVVKPLKPVLN